MEEKTRTYAAAPVSFVCVVVGLAVVGVVEALRVIVL